MVNQIILAVIIIAVIILIIMLIKTLFKWAIIVLVLILIIYGASMFLNGEEAKPPEVNMTDFNIGCEVDEDCASVLSVDNGCNHECAEDCEDAKLCQVMNKEELVNLEDIQCITNNSCLNGEIKCIDNKCMNIIPLEE